MSQPANGVQLRDDANPHVPAKRLNELPAVHDAIKALAASHRRDRARQRERDRGGLRREARDLLDFASRHPYWPVARLYELINKPAPAVQKAIRKELQEGGYAVLQDVRVGKKQLCLIELLDAAWEILGRPRFKKQGGGGLAHRTFANWLVMVAEKRGYEAICEWTVPGTNHRADVASKVDGKWQTFEVVDKCEMNIACHLKAALLTPESPVETVTIVASQKIILDHVRAQLEPLPEFESCKDRVHFVPVEVFEKELWPK